MGVVLLMRGRRREARPATTKLDVMRDVCVKKTRERHAVREMLRHEAPWGVCRTGDEGRPFGAAVQAEAPNHPELLRPKAVVVSVREKA